jgi:hypothetical protein
MMLCTQCREKASVDYDLLDVKELRSTLKALFKEREAQLITNIGICYLCGHAWELSAIEKININAMRNSLIKSRRGYFV